MAGPIIARIPQTIPAAAPIPIKFGVKCAVTVPPDPANMDRPNLSTRYVPNRKPLGTPNNPPRRPTAAPFTEHPAEQPDRLCADRADGSHHRPPVLHGQQDRVHGDEDADEDAGQRGQVEILCGAFEYGRQVRPGRACRCDAGDDAVDVGRDVGALSRRTNAAVA